MKTLDAWESESKAHHPYTDEFDDRILALIDLVRKKDEALEFFLENIGWTQDVSSTQRWKQKTEKALELTEKLNDQT